MENNWINQEILNRLPGVAASGGGDGGDGRGNLDYRKKSNNHAWSAEYANREEQGYRI